MSAAVLFVNPIIVCLFLVALRFSPNNLTSLKPSLLLFLPTIKEQEPWSTVFPSPETNTASVVPVTLLYWPLIKEYLVSKTVFLAPVTKELFTLFGAIVFPSSSVSPTLPTLLLLPITAPAAITALLEAPTIKLQLLISSAFCLVRILLWPTTKARSSSTVFLSPTAPDIAALTVFSTSPSLTFVAKEPSPSPGIKLAAPTGLVSFNYAEPSPTYNYFVFLE